MTKYVAIVTGAAGDIGRAIASRLADDHDVILLVDIDVGRRRKGSPYAWLRRALRGGEL
jgi:NAD(P)-dependent dehydrogenase (short-subunit alcohol dehydrogenase family)